MRILSNTAPKRGTRLTAMRCGMGPGKGACICGSKCLSAFPGRFFGYFLIGIRKYRPRQGAAVRVHIGLDKNEVPAVRAVEGDGPYDYRAHLVGGVGQ